MNTRNSLGCDKTQYFQFTKTKKYLVFTESNGCPRPTEEIFWKPHQKTVNFEKHTFAKAQFILSSNQIACVKQESLSFKARLAKKNPTCFYFAAMKMLFISSNCHEKLDSLLEDSGR